jgi:hypothetical protein
LCCIETVLRLCSAIQHCSRRSRGVCVCLCVCRGGRGLNTVSIQCCIAILHCSRRSRLQTCYIASECEQTLVGALLGLFLCLLHCGTGCAGVFVAMLQFVADFVNHLQATTSKGPCAAKKTKSISECMVLRTVKSFCMYLTLSVFREETAQIVVLRAQQIVSRSRDR